jgi:hypothetical protein
MKILLKIRRVLMKLNKNLRRYRDYSLFMVKFNFTKNNECVFTHHNQCVRALTTSNGEFINLYNKHNNDIATAIAHILHEM